MIKSLITSAVSSALPLAVNNTVGDVKTKIAELGSKVKNVFNNSGPFTKLGANAPSLTSTAKEQLLARTDLKAIAPNMTTQDIDEKIRDMAGNPWQGTELDSDAATKLVQDAVDQDVTAAQMKQAKNENAPVEQDLSHIIKLTEVWSSLEVPFRIMPEITESRSVEYEAVQPPQSPSAFQKYKGTTNTQWTVNATFICRTSAEATNNLIFLNRLRGWTMPFFGSKLSRYGQEWASRLGAPPPVLILEGWRQNMLGPTYVVITSLNWNFPRDVDYIPAYEIDSADTGEIMYRDDTTPNIPFPTVMQLQIQLVEAFSTDQVNGFDLPKFRAGKYKEAFERLPRGQAGTITEWAEDVQQEAQQVGSGQTNVTSESTSPPSEPEAVQYTSPEEPLTNRTGGYYGGGE